MTEPLTKEELKDFLQDFISQNDAQTLYDEEVDEEVFLDLKEADFKDIGLKLGARKKLLKIISDVKRETKKAKRMQKRMQKTDDHEDSTSSTIELSSRSRSSTSRAKQKSKPKLSSANKSTSCLKIKKSKKVKHRDHHWRSRSNSPLMSSASNTPERITDLPKHHSLLKVSPKVESFLDSDRHSRSKKKHHKQSERTDMKTSVYHASSEKLEIADKSDKELLKQRIAYEEEIKLIKTKFEHAKEAATHANRKLVQDKDLTLVGLKSVGGRNVSLICNFADILEWKPSKPKPPTESAVYYCIPESENYFRTRDC